MGERQTEDLKVPGSIPSRGIHYEALNDAIGEVLDEYGWNTDDNGVQ